jgi:hypothetical protein
MRRIGGFAMRHEKPEKRAATAAVFGLELQRLTGRYEFD